MCSSDLPEANEQEADFGWHLLKPLIGCTADGFGCGAARRIILVAHGEWLLWQEPVPGSG